MCYPSLADKAYHLILDQMLRGILPIGSVLSRRKLAAGFQMSLVPVAEALQRLEIEGLVESRPRVGTRVKTPTADDIREHFELRQALECQAARLCAERSTFQERLELRRLATNVDSLYKRESTRGFNPDHAFAVNEYHKNLHMRIAECARSELLRSEIENSHVLTFNWLYDATAGRRFLPPKFHENLINPIVGGNSQEAEDVMRAHVSHGLASVQLAIQPLKAKKWRLKR